MFHACKQARALYTAHHRRRRLSRKVRVFGIIFEISAAQRVAVNVHRRRKHNIHARGNAFFAKPRAHGRYDFFVPRAGEKRSAGETARFRCAANPRRSVCRLRVRHTVFFKISNAACGARKRAKLPLRKMQKLAIRELRQKFTHTLFAAFHLRKQYFFARLLDRRVLWQHGGFFPLVRRAAYVVFRFAAYLFFHRNRADFFCGSHVFAEIQRIFAAFRNVPFAAYVFFKTFGCDFKHDFNAFARREKRRFLVSAKFFCGGFAQFFGLFHIALKHRFPRAPACIFHRCRYAHACRRAARVFSYLYVFYQKFRIRQAEAERIQHLFGRVRFKMPIPHVNILGIIRIIARNIKRCRRRIIFVCFCRRIRKPPRRIHFARENFRDRFPARHSRQKRKHDRLDFRVVFKLGKVDQSRRVRDENHALHVRFFNHRKERALVFREPIRRYKTAVRIGIYFSLHGFGVCFLFGFVGRIGYLTISAFRSVTR